MPREGADSICSSPSEGQDRTGQDRTGQDRVGLNIRNTEEEEDDRLERRDLSDGDDAAM